MRSNRRVALNKQFSLHDSVFHFAKKHPSLRMKVAVVGGGVVGLTTTLLLQQELRNAEITVLASDFDDIVSYVAAGIFRISASYSGPTEQITR